MSICAMCGTEYRRDSAGREHCLCPPIGMDDFPQRPQQYEEITPSVLADPLDRTKGKGYWPTHVDGMDAETLADAIYELVAVFTECKVRRDLAQQAWTVKHSQASGNAGKLIAYHGPRIAACLKVCEGIPTDALIDAAKLPTETRLLLARLALAVANGETSKC